MIGQSITVTLHAWWMLAYLAVGSALWLPLNYLAWKDIAPPKPGFWADMFSHFRRHGALGSIGRIMLMVVLWPVAVWEGVR